MGATEKLYVLGHPVGHSKSPAMHNAVYRALGLPWEYGFADIEHSHEAQAFIEQRSWLGLNITTPYKELAFAAADTASEAARLARGANVLVKIDGKLAAHNTDGFGCVTYLQSIGACFEGARVVVCGTGPTSFSILCACVDAGASVLMLGRDAQRARERVEAWRAAYAACVAHDEHAVCAFQTTRTAQTAREARSKREVRVEGVSYDDSRSLISCADIVIDATPLGMKPGDPAPFDVSALHEGQWVFDAVYGHGETALAAGAKAAGCTFRSGGGMLVGQAVAAVQLFLQAAGEPDTLGFDGLLDVMARAAGFAL
ncbi:shikimate dehydrogenase [Adlercreutzia sp. ZJ138]|uniref:shikimate dehydrogenase family protein n=1 Tax=Adlercreutzia sp. ZJ138 TaxID=2709405 RepID=UPI0013EBEC1E|nr:shikimate dehydrogenase [Adlercreutzia sp. ZJ138]